MKLDEFNENGDSFQPPFKKQKTFSSGGGGSVKSEEILAHRKSLPIYSVRSKLVEEIKKNKITILIGETGCGKTTQLPQFLDFAFPEISGIIGVTQPRRVAAITVAERVALEMKATLGELVGYCVRFDDHTSEQTKIKYMTDGMLLREAIIDPLLKRYSFIILDEAHERTIHTDVLFGIVKNAQRERETRSMKKLKIVVMSATMDVDHFSQYFNNAPVIYLEGRQHAVQVFHTKEAQSDYLFASIVSTYQIHREAPANHDILIFLTGQDEIEAVIKTMIDINKTSSEGPPMMVFPLYAALPQAMQLKVFRQTPLGQRKVIVSTNIAETSVTITGIKYIIDSGKVKAKCYDPKTGFELLKVQPISKAQAWQRTGRAGRESNGFCYRLYPETDYEAMAVNMTPEIRRCNPASVVLELLALGIEDVMNFDFLDKPTHEAFAVAFELLQLLGAIQYEDSMQKLTETGRQMAYFPLDPRMSKCILASQKYGCTEDVITIISLLSVDTLFHTPMNKREEAHRAREKFFCPEGDHLTLLNVFRSYVSVKGNNEWCHENFINKKNMQMAADVRQQLKEICQRMGMEIKSTQNKTDIRKCVAAGYFMNAAELTHNGEYRTIANRQTITIHPSSVLFRHNSQLVIFNELVQTSKNYMRSVCVVDPDWLLEINPDYFGQKLRR